MGRRVLGSLFDNAFGLISTVLAFVCGLSFLALSIHPAEKLFFQWVGLFLPVLLLINIGLLVYWGIRRRIWFWFPLLALIANYWYYPSIFNTLPANTNSNTSARNIVLATYNVSSFQDRTNGYSLHHISDMVTEKRVDVFCIQEVPLNLSADSLLAAFPLFSHIAITDPIKDGFGMVVLSKFPIIDFEIISFAERQNCALKADLDVLGKRISVLNCHLQTTNWNQRNLLRFNKKIDSFVKQKKVMDNNFILRAYQADIISGIIHSLPYPVIVCGDFNDTPSSYVYHRMKGALNDSFHSSNFYYSYTYRYMYKLLRIDYLFYSPESFSGKKYESPNIGFSDHNPVIVTLELNY